MFREKLIPKSTQRGYLYIRDSVYVRDRRTLKRIPKKLGDGSATKKRGQYSKKKDIYCGRIIEVKPEKLTTFNEFLYSRHKDVSLFKNESDFDKVLNEFVEYVIEIYGIDKDEFFSIKKKAYTIGDGFMSPIIIEWFKAFKIKGEFHNVGEFKRFSNRAYDCGIFDDDIINLLYLKLVPEVEKENILEEIDELKDKKLENVKSNFRNFIRKSG